MRRVVLILIIVGVLVVLAGGTVWYLHRNSTAKLLARAEVAMQAKQFERSLELSEAAIAKEPDNWRGYFVRAAAYSNLLKFDDARRSLDEAAKHNPPGVTVELAIADTYAMPGRRTLASEDAGRQPAALREAIAQIKKANEYLAGIKAAEGKDRLDVRQAVGLNLVQMGFGQRALAAGLEQEAQRAESAGDAAARQKATRESADASKAAAKTLDEAGLALLEVVKGDPRRDLAARTLVEVGVATKDPKLLAAASENILSQEDPPARAAVMLIRNDLDTTEGLSRAERSKKLAAAAAKLEAILAKHPDELDAKLARAEVALRQRDWAKAEGLCKEVLAAKPTQTQQLQAKFTQARALIAQGKAVEAETLLGQVKTVAAQSPEAQYAYALAAMAVGKKEPAREAMRTVTRLDPKHGGARRFLAQSLLDDGFAAEAFPDANEYLKEHPDDPDALRLFVRAAKARDQEGLAEEKVIGFLKACDKDLGDYLAGLAKGKLPEPAEIAKFKGVPANPERMLAAAEAFDELGDRARAMAVRRRAAECRVTTSDESLATAEALVAVGRVPEAEQRLTQKRTEDPDDARFAWGLARLYEGTGRGSQAIEAYRAAVKIEPQVPAYRESLARALLGAGLLDDCVAECQAILSGDPTNARAQQFVAQVRLIRGEVNLDEMLRQSGAAAPTGLRLAQTYRNNGQTPKCIDLCLAELKKTPANADARSLLGQAYLDLGQTDKAIEQWTAAVKDAPTQIVYYLQLADVLSKGKTPEEIQAAMAAIPGAKRDMLDLVTAWLFDRAGRHDAAAESYGRLVERQDASAGERDRARLLRAQSLARAGKLDQALAELDKLAAEPNWQTSALLAKASLLAASNRAKEAESLLASLDQRATKDKDYALLDRLIPMYMDLSRSQEALAAADRLVALAPSDSRPYAVRAAILASLERLPEAAECYRKAIERQPGNHALHLALARALDAAGDPPAAMKELKDFEAEGEAARPLALFELGDMYARWGLPAQAAETYEALAKLGHEGDPRLQLALGQAFARLGNKGRAREVLGKIPAYAAQYVPARQVLSELEDTDEAKLKVLRDVRKAKKGQGDVLLHEMRILMDAGRPAEAVKALQEFVADGNTAPEAANGMALQAMDMAQDWRGATALAARTAEETRSPRWRLVAALLAIEVDPNAAKGFLADPAKAEASEAVLGLLAASRDGQPLDPWKARLAELLKAPEKAPAGAKLPPRMPPAVRLLAALVAGAKGDADAQLAAWQGGGIGRAASAELVASAANNPKADAEARELLKASLALDMGLPTAAREWAMKILKARPTCQWAAALVLQSNPAPAYVADVLQTLQPADCLLAQTVRARRFVDANQNDKAAEIWKAVATADKTNAEAVMNLGIALERAGRPEEALPLYRQVWESSKHPIAGNNATYIVTQLHAKDSARLAEAAGWMEAVVKTAPGVPAFRDTLGWVAHLQGRDDVAVIELRRAVKGLPESPEVHYHLGTVEAALGHADLARWHLAATVSLGEKLKAQKGGLSASAQQAVRLAGEALAKRDKPKP